MKKITELVILENKSGQRLRVHKIEDRDTYAISIEGNEDHFEFGARDVIAICNAISKMVDG